MSSRDVLRLTPAEKESLKFLFLAKHVLGNGRPHPEDGSHAVYHRELLQTIRSIGIQTAAANSYAALFERPDADYVIPLLNRGGFQNSEMLGPLLLARHRMPFLGASPIIRGLSDDKHLMKMVARARDVPTADWSIFRRSALAQPPELLAESYIVKPNASSASWGIKRCGSWSEAVAHAAHLNACGHDSIAEPWIGNADIAVPVIGARGPRMLPAMAYKSSEAGGLRSYEEKRNLVAEADDVLEPVADRSLGDRLERLVQRILPELWPFDYGRFEFRYDDATGELRFMEVNLSCNLWSRKTISRSAALAGIDHQALVETILTHSLARQGVIRRPLALRFAA